MVGGNKTNYVHKSGPFKQSNKNHKHGRHRTKGQIDASQKGKVSCKKSSQKTAQLGKSARKLQTLQHRKNKRMEAIEKKRSTGEIGAPHVIVLVQLDLSCNSEKAVDLFTQSGDFKVMSRSHHSAAIISPKHKQRFTILIPEQGNMFSVLDAAQVADTILFLSSLDSCFCPLTEKIFNCLLAQGLPNTVFALQGLSSVSEKKRTDSKSSFAKSLQKWFSAAKLSELDSAEDAAMLLWRIGNQKRKSLFYRENRPYLLAEKIEFIHNSNQDLLGTLKVSGYLRGRTLDVNGLVHIPGAGDFQLKQIDLQADPYTFNKRSAKPSFVPMEVGDAVKVQEDIRTVAIADPALQTSLDNEPGTDLSNQDQTLPSDDEFSENSRFSETGISHSNSAVRKMIPKGTSEYQCSWILDSENGSDDECDEDYLQSSNNDEYKMADVENESDIVDEDEQELDTVSISTDILDDKYDQTMDMEEEKKMLEKHRAERENEMFPDEIDTPFDVPARQRFERYRGLKSFRSSPWDPDENLPVDFTRVYKFANFERTRKHIYIKQQPDEELHGSFITAYIQNVPATVFENTAPFFTLFGLLEHEHKMTVMHFVIKKHPSFGKPLKSKEPLIFHVGYRRFSNCPIFSQHTTGNKFKFERFLPKDGASVATVFAPVIFPPAPVLMFAQDGSLVAAGTVYKSDPGRIILKKIVLSGHPFKINKKSVVVRHMFFNRDDVLWFKPIELYSKHGRYGYIKEPLGTHGHMKCTFDGQLKAQDTICMSLYKRVFPKWTYNPEIRQFCFNT